MRRVLVCMLLLAGSVAVSASVPAGIRAHQRSADALHRPAKGVRFPVLAQRESPLLHPGGIAPAAGFTSTVNDLARFASWQFRVLAGDDMDNMVRLAHVEGDAFVCVTDDEQREAWVFVGMRR